MRAKSVGHVEYEILKYLLTEEGANLANPRGLTDLFIGLGADFDGRGEWTPMKNTKDKPAQKRCRTARNNIANILLNMLVKRERHLPETHTDAGCDRDDLLDVLGDLI